MTLLGADGSLQGTFLAIKAAKRIVTISLLGGETQIGLVTGEPSTTYVVLRRDEKDNSGDADILVLYAAMATVQVPPT
jgi:hypothetical protein